MINRKPEEANQAFVNAKRIQQWYARDLKLLKGNNSLYIDSYI